MLHVATFNLRCVWDGDGVNAFINRAGGIIEKIHQETPDIIGFQEATEKNVGFLRRALTDYYIVYSQRCQGWEGEGAACAYRRDRFNLQSMDCFWLSPTPSVPGSRFAEQSDCPRVCQALLLKDMQERRMLRVYNTHLDHISDKARVLGMQAVLERIRSDTQAFDLPYFLMGDFNAEPGSGPIALCAGEAGMKELTETIGGTFHNFGRRETPSKIDYIYADEQTAARLRSVERWMECVNGVYLSDHYPVAAKLDW